MRVLPVVSAAAAVVALVGAVALLVRHDPNPPNPPGAPDIAEEQLWTGTATLLKTPKGELTLCGGGILLSLPPAGCGGAVVRGLDPMTVPGATRYPNGTITTPSVRLVGTWDGKALTVTRPAVRAEPPPGGPSPAIPGPSCPEPEGGWPFDKVDMEGMGRVNDYVASQPDGGTPRVDESQRILTAPFTGDLDRHRAAIAKLYDGPVCVELAERSEKELGAVFDRVEAELQARGLKMLSGNRGGSGRPYVEVTVVALTPEEKAELEKSYDGMLRLSTFLTRV